VRGKDPEQGLVFVEAYPPSSAVNLMEKHSPRLVDTFHCRRQRWAAFQKQFKLVRIDGVRDELYDLSADPAEIQNRIAHHPELAAKLSDKLRAFIAHAIARQPNNWQANQLVDIENDENIARQLRALGYID